MRKKSIERKYARERLEEVMVICKLSFSGFEELTRTSMVPKASPGGSVYACGHKSPL